MNTRLREDIERMIASSMLTPATPFGDPRDHLSPREIERVADLAQAICDRVDREEPPPFLA